MGRHLESLRVSRGEKKIPLGIRRAAVFSTEILLCFRARGVSLAKGPSRGEKDEERG